jgi:hypothetical protein
MTITQFKSYFNGRARNRGWTNQEIAEFYRVSDILGRSGLSIAVDQGETDEGDPWLVFFREETGDVIAHFARVNSQFLAVSSLDNRLYRGEDVRAVVQQMLNGHPMFLPKGNQSGRLFLHPSAALTAFVAAAFILSIDGVKAKTLSEILVEVSNSNLPQESQTEDSLRNEIAKLELSRVVAMDLTPLNYNAAVYGMIVIARQFLPEEEIHKTLDPELSAKVPLDEFYGEPSSRISESFPAPMIEVGDGVVSYSQLENPVEIKKEINQAPVSGKDVEVSPKNDMDKKFTTASVTEAINESFATSNADFIELQTSTNNKNSFGYSVDLSASTQKVTSEKFEQISENNSYPLVFGDDKKSVGEIDLQLDLISVAMDKFEKLQTIVSKEFVETDVIKGGISLEAGSDGELFFVGFDNAMTDNTIVFKDVYFDNTIEVAVELLSADTVEIESLTEATSHSSGEKDVPRSPQSTFQPELPIVGHDIQKVGQKFAPMTDGIDVVFYRGGDFTVTNYELGKDLLWFLLPPEELSPLDSYIRNGTDLVMTFGELGSLTLPGVFSDVAPIDAFL